MHNESSSFLCTKIKGQWTRCIFHYGLWWGRCEGKGAHSAAISPHLPLCNCLFHWIVMDEGVFKRVLFSAACFHAESPSILHNTLKEKRNFHLSVLSAPHTVCLDLIHFSFMAFMQLMPHNRCSGGVQFSYFCMRSVWTEVISGKELHQVLKEREQS